MVDVQKYLEENRVDNVYAIVKYDGKEELVYFTKQYYKGKPWWLESPCQDVVIDQIAGDIDLQKHINSRYYFTDEESYTFLYEDLISMIRNGLLYEIYSPQVEPYLPKEVDSIETITESKALDLLLKKEK